MKEWQEIVLWIISIFGFVLSLSKWIWDIKKAIPLLRISFESENSQTIILHNISEETFVITELKLIFHGEKSEFILFPRFERFTINSFRINAGELNYQKLDFRELDSYIHQNHLNFPLLYRVIVKNNLNKVFRSKVKYLLETTEESYAIENREFRSFFTAYLSLIGKLITNNWRNKRKTKKD